MQTDNTQAQEPLRCLNPACGRELARTVRFCPYCGHRQFEEPIEPVEAPSPLPTATTPLPQSQPEQEPEPQPAPEPPPEPPVATTAETPPVSTETEQAEPEPGNAEMPPPKPTGKPRRWIWVAAAAAALVAWFAFHRDANMPVTVTAQPDAWADVDLGGFDKGAKIVITADGPFRIRAGDIAPILVRTPNDAVTIDALPRKGVEVKATGGPVHVRFDKADATP